MKQRIDINADLGEGMRNDALIMPFISSCNIACGGHYGDDASMRETVRLAVAHGVKVGAHPSFPDRDHFGRKRMTLSKEELSESLFQQLLHFMAVCELEDVPVHHVKLHGALYNYASVDAAASDAVISALERTKLRTWLYCPFGSVLHRKAENLFPLRFEAFIDRRYTAKGTLVPRSDANAVIDDSLEAWEQLRSLLERGTVRAVDGQRVLIEASTFCVHGDNEASVHILRFLHEKMMLHHYSLDK